MTKNVIRYEIREKLNLIKSEYRGREAEMLSWLEFQSIFIQLSLTYCPVKQSGRKL